MKSLSLTFITNIVINFMIFLQEDAYIESYGNDKVIILLK